MNRLLLIISFVLFVAKASLGLTCNECKELDDNDFCKQDVKDNWKAVPCAGYCIKTTETTDHGEFVKRYCGGNQMPFEGCRDPDALRFGRNRGSKVGRIDCYCNDQDNCNGSSPLGFSMASVGLLIFAISLMNLNL